MIQLPNKKYDLLYVDPPWKYNNTISNGAAENHYPSMTLPEMMQMPINSITKPDCVMFMWHVPTHPMEALKLVEAWGFKFKSMKAFTWVKLNKRFQRVLKKKFCISNDEFDQLGELEVLQLLRSFSKMNGGNYTRANSEDVLVAVKGKGLERLDAAVKQIIFSPLGEPSEKPAQVRNEIEKLYGNDIDRLEMFSRRTLVGWDTFGNEVGKLDAIKEVA
ncbi:MT-A70 family methyltransferase [Vibrio sp.]|uniref:MT-A70 family methyltransferase n=1 Tax=Vibrio sp. TaxID=678 RepID=UPI00378FCD58